MLALKPGGTETAPLSQWASLGQALGLGSERAAVCGGPAEGRCREPNPHSSLGRSLHGTVSSQGLGTVWAEKSGGAQRHLAGILSFHPGAVASSSASLPPHSHPSATRTPPTPPRHCEAGPKPDPGSPRSGPRSFSSAAPAASVSSAWPAGTFPSRRQAQLWRAGAPEGHRPGASLSRLEGSEGCWESAKGPCQGASSGLMAGTLQRVKRQAGWKQCDLEQVPESLGGENRMRGKMGGNEKNKFCFPINRLLLLPALWLREGEAARLPSLAPTGPASAPATCRAQSA